MLLPKPVTNFEPKPACKNCHRRRCRDLLYWETIPVIYPEFVPFDCPMKLQDELDIHRALNALDTWELTRLTGKIWVNFNSSVRYVNGDNIRGDETKHVFSFLRQGLCEILSRSADTDYKPCKFMKPYSLREDVSRLALLKKTKGDKCGDEEKSAQKSEQKKQSSFHIRLNIDPNDENSQDDTFTLFSTDAAKSYNQVLTVKDDNVPGDSYTDLHFAGLDDSLLYSLKIGFGKDGESVIFFENIPYGEMHG
jgi:hypothetical protein